VVTDIFEAANRTASYNWIAISPDGARVAWVQGSTLRIGSAEVALPSATPQRSDRMPAWSPDSRHVAFLSDAGGAALWIADAESLAARRVVQLEEFAQWPRWSPDGRSIAFLTGGRSPAMPSPPLTGVIDRAIPNQRIAVVNVASGRMETISPPGRYVYDFDWSPDTRCLVAAAAPGPGGKEWWRAELCVLTPATQAVHSIYSPELQIGCPRWSPDGKRFAFVEGLMGDQTLTGGDLCTIAATGGAPVNHMAGRTTTATSLVWLSPDEILFTEYTGGGSNISILNLPSGSIEVRWHGDEEARASGRIPNLSAAASGEIVAMVRSSYEAPQEVWLGPPGAWRQITHENAAIRPSWGKAESIELISEGRQMQAWLIPPANPGPGQHPMIVEAHGGPSGIATPVWRGADSVALLAAAGYYVLLPNPRGSYGQGSAFQGANARDFGYGDLRDILAAVDAAIERYPIDPGRVGIMGWSYGGFLAMFAVTQTARFQAAVAGAGIANWNSYYGQNVVDHWMVPYFGANPFDDPAVYDRSSPIHFIKQVATPTLVVAGEQDAECPPEQSYEFWQALKTLGVPTELVVYPGEGHALMQPGNRRDEAARTLAWFDRYVG
jgi:dipeptidyl aminopeptidase/acylaminoacyl peptidase